MMNATVPQAVQLCHELLRWLMPHIDKFPRVRRFTLAQTYQDIQKTGLINLSVAQSG